jgi:chromosome partitioning protein
MLVLTVGGIKGGSGKTTLAVNLAVLESQAGARVLLVDGDPQGTASEFTDIREGQHGSAGYVAVRLYGAELAREVRKLAPGFDLVVIDVGGADNRGQRSALLVSDRALFPFVPRSFDVWTVGQVCDVLKDAIVLNERLRPFAVLNRSDTRGRDPDAAEDAIRQHGIEVLPCRIATRKAIAEASGMGLAVHELRPRNLEAIAELAQLQKNLLREGALA